MSKARQLAPGFLTALAALALAACAPRMYQRSTVILDQSNLEDYTIKYGELDCLLKQQVPQTYGVARPRYALALRVGSGTGGAAPRIEVIVRGAGELSARFAELAEQPEGSVSSEGSRYSVDTALLKNQLTVEVSHGEEVIGSEFFRFKPRSCSAVSLGPSPPK